MVYACSTPSLSVLEIRVHTGPEGEGILYALCQIELPKKLVTKFDNTYLPSDWNLNPPQLSTQKLGSDWARGRTSVVLQVPSILVPVDFNFLINPLHEEFKKIRVTDVQDYALERLW